MGRRNLISDYFQEIQQSEVWPSNNPEDSPFNKFICDLCSFSFECAIYGSFPLGTNPYSEVRRKMREHLAVK